MIADADLEGERWNLRWVAELSSRYHRRHATWLNNLDFVLNIVQMLSATAAFVELTRGAPGWVAAAGTVIVGLCALTQVIGRLGKAALDHELLMRDWCDLLTEIETNNATGDLIKKWMKRRGELNKLHVGELRALAVAAENETATALGVMGRQRHISRLQWWLMHIVTFQRHYASSPDINPAPPS